MGDWKGAMVMMVSVCVSRSGFLITLFVYLSLGYAPFSALPNNELDLNSVRMKQVLAGNDNSAVPARTYNIPELGLFKAENAFRQDHGIPFHRPIGHPASVQY